MFLDEIFKCNDGVLNSLLTALNERKYTNEGRTYPIPAVSFFAASNGIPNFNDPQEKILEALYDRLELKVVTDNIADRDKRLAVLADKQAGRSGQIAASITLDELDRMQGEVADIPVPDAVNELADDILCQLRKDGIRDFKNKGTGERATDFIDCVAWRTTGEFVSKYLAKGRMAMAEGRLQIREWTNKEGNKRRSAEVVADNVYFADSKKEDGQSPGGKGRGKPAEDDFDLPDDFRPGGNNFADLADDDGDLPF